MLMNRKISIAPMVNITDEHFRYLIRLLSKKVTLYTPMISAKSIIMGDVKKIVKQNPLESPIAIQIATNSKNDALKAIQILEKHFNFDEYNLNVGCPSLKIQNANCGACLMSNANQVGEILKTMKENTNKPISIKHRLGIRPLSSDYKNESYSEVKNFVKIISDFGIKNFIVHARIAILKGFSPKNNRNIPKLRHEFVYNLKKENKNLFIEINGGINNSEQIKKHLSFVDSVMIGRSAFENPYFIANASREFLNETDEILTRKDILMQMVEYIKEYENYLSINILFKHLMGIVFSKEGAKKFRQNLTAPFPKNLKKHEILLKAIETLPEKILNSNS
ncbi:tRNA dihydrouridine(20/20a) synthase DusA [Borreliella burgdorferi]|uniref:tRNA dihydrouridine(20/20a) synthase DusA n=1 Tax=Borreliella burgdorferi TaxID=139 RepID=UPI000493CCE5|nr:tRNA dihydrouridine(20/20a) synthase DusA [Borreliella burgdorferi]MCD2320761.1 tRNA dihydrouridine(20/20a) synthase DusA [Borreliella burgdorferi]MCD2321702.1 tRNA dihydrouridine(20/20a) synthase DusA [Borreliella burgdorferi]MCD2384479.1 tRNA dihydrouridine(20/20a) synthase DusA [Borreliella burgdorferi]MCD2393390.1 tRNA dihydrouridine(20/20a) synthase DusA [Borreliella burgdorferi]MCD2409766.1 tRNA dihydrouridine(20/20a) synthase DusA [Borreliella burgdorferi]